jgi:hypothetical protein
MVIGPVVLQGARARARDPRSQYRRRHGNDPVAKVPVIVQPRTWVVLSVDARDRRNASLEYREATRGAQHVRDGDPAVSFKACFDDTPSGWPGGFLLTGPRCVRVTLAIRGRNPVQRTLRFGRKAC